jgi:hypothetical protein
VNAHYVSNSQPILPNSGPGACGSEQLEALTTVKLCKHASSHEAIVIFHCEPDRLHCAYRMQHSFDFG